MPFQKLGNGESVWLGPERPHKSPGGAIGGRSVFSPDITGGLTTGVLSMSRHSKGPSQMPRGFTIKKP